MPNTVEVRYSDRSANIVHSFSFTDNLNATFNKERGITWDGKYFWFTTTGAPGRLAKLVQVDPISQKQVSFANLGGVPNFDVIGVVFNGVNFYTLAVDPSLPASFVYLNMHDRRGKRLRGPVSVPTTDGQPRDLAFDGRMILISRVDLDFGTLGHSDIEFWDSVSMKKVGEVQLSGILGSRGPGITLDGVSLIVRSDPVLNATKLFYLVDRRLTTQKRLVVGPSTQAGDEAAITMAVWNGHLRYVDFKVT